MIYLATPYTAEFKELESVNYQKACRISKFFADMNLFVYSPIAYWHSIAERFKLPTNAKYWENINIQSLEKCFLYEAS